MIEQNLPSSDRSPADSEAEGGRLLPQVPVAIHDGKDEMNFAEFPLSVISKRTEPATKTLVFEDEIVDQKTGKPMRRRVTVSGTDDVGLPTSTDDDVLLALIQVAKLQKFASRRVYFTRYHVLKILGWPPSGQNYKRLALALERWQGVKMKYENAWRAENKWASDEYFHIIDNVQINQEEGAPGADHEQTNFEFASSYFVWNEVVFKSFQSSNLKSLDFAAVMALDSAISRRLYRFLDKRFYQRSRVEFDLRNLAYEHIGIARSTPLNEVKRQISESVLELEESLFLRRMDKKSRFIKESVGAWRVVFEKYIPGELALDVETTDRHPDAQNLASRSPLEEQLCAAGVRPDKAGELVRKFDGDHILTKLEVLSFLQNAKAPNVSLNPAGFLIKSIEENFENPKGFVSSIEKKERTRKEQERREQRSQKQLSEDEAKRLQIAEEEAAIAGFWKSLSATERKKEQRLALSAPNQYQQAALLRGGTEAEYVRQLMLDQHALKRVQEGREMQAAQTA